MTYKAKEIEVPNDDPFQNDQLNREEEVRNITTLLQNISTPIVFSINAPWGTGKTTFLKMLHKNLLNEGNNAIYFSAWETDFATDPLLAFLGEINNAIESQFENLNKEAWDRAKKVGGLIVKQGIPIALRVASMGALKLDDFLEEGISELMENVSSDLIKDYEERKSSIDSFKKSISELTGDGDDGTIFIIIDELDRCRPTYAIELLERVKHLLNVNGIVFVLALDREQLSHSVRGLYGSGFGAKGYLKRFIDIEYSLNPVNIDHFIDHLFKQFQFDRFFKDRVEMNSRAFEYDERHLKRTIKLLSNSQNMSLRDIEQLVGKLNLVLLSTNEREYLYPALLSFLLIVKSNFRETYNEFVKEGTSPKPLIDLLKSLITKPTDKELHIIGIIEGLILSSKVNHPHYSSNEIINQHKSIRDGKMEKAKEKEYSELVLHVVQQPAGHSRQPVSLDSLISRIEMTRQFSFTSNESDN